MAMIRALHETCLEYFIRRQREGWKCISLEGYNAVLLSPSGIRRELDLRNDTETLRPNAAGDETNIEEQWPDETFHWDKVDEDGEGDGATTRVRTGSTSYQRDLYNLPASSGSGTINFIKVYFRCYLGYNDVGFVKPVIRSDSTITEGDEISNKIHAYTLYSQQWNTNPADDEDWEWADIDALQIGITLKSTSGESNACTQVYVEIDFTPSVAVEPKHTFRLHPRPGHRMGFHPNLKLG